MKPRIMIHSACPESLSTANDGNNVQGDELVAHAWRKYLRRRDDVLLATDPGEADFIVYFSLFSQPHQKLGRKELLYLQNVFPPEAWAGGTVGQFSQHKHKFDAFIFTSETLKKNCDTDGAVIPFATDPEQFYPREADQRYAHPLCFVGNNIRGQAANERYLRPALEHGLAIYGNPIYWPAPYAAACKGKLPLEDETTLYASARACLNVHVPEHVTHDSVNFRIYNILACGGILISDRTPTLEAVYQDFLWFTDGADIGSVLHEAFSRPEESLRRAQAGQEYVLAHHTFERRVDALVEFVKQL
jgi:hypothetical protein